MVSQEQDPAHIEEDGACNEEEEEWTRESLIGFLKKAHPLLSEFAAALIEDCGEEETAALLTKDWDWAYPADFLGDDINNDISNFLYNMGHFCLERAEGESKYDERLEGYLNIYVLPSYEDASYILICDYNTSTVVATYSAKTWYFKPDVLEEDIGDLVKSVKRGIKLVRSRDTSSILVGASKQLEKAETMLKSASTSEEVGAKLSALTSDIKGIRKSLLDLVDR